MENTNGVEGEKKMFTAMLELTFEDLFSKNAYLRRSAETYIYRENQDYPTSFDNICDYLGMDAGIVRNGLKDRYLAFSRQISRNENNMRPKIAPCLEKNQA